MIYAIIAFRFCLLVYFYRNLEKFYIKHTQREYYDEFM